MVFSSFVFLSAFLPAFFLLYYAAPSRLKNLVALLGSYFFYAWGAPQVVLVLLLSCWLDYVFARWIARTQAPKPILALAVGMNVLLLAYYKYSNFFIGELNGFFEFIGLRPIAWAAVALPIGVSFFTFQKISFLVDIYRGTAALPSRFLNYALYVVLFPQLIAGPIVRFHDVAAQIEKRVHRLDDICYGIYRFCLGLGKKVLIADPLGLVADNVFALELSQLSGGYAWLGVVCYSFQIYFDFSGYSDMAIGLGRMMGLRFLENFNMPYISQSITEFWRRWHISLSNWMREYLYIPLGGNRTGHTYRNLWIVFLLSGLWHGASWNFVIWGAFHGFFLAFDKLFWLKRLPLLPLVARIGLTYFIVLLSWVFFRAETLSQAMQYLGAMIGLIESGWEPIFRGNVVNNRALCMLVVAAVFSFLPAHDWVTRLRDRWQLAQRPVWQTSAALTCLLLSLCALAGAGYTPFLYFRF